MRPPRRPLKLRQPTSPLFPQMQQAQSLMYAASSRQRRPCRQPEFWGGYCESAIRSSAQDTQTSSRILSSEPSPAFTNQLLILIKMKAEQSFEDSLRQSALLNQKPPKQKKQQIIKPADDEIKIIDLLQPTKSQAQVAQKVANGKLDFIFNAARDVTLAKPYYEDGNQDLYTPEALTKRRKMKADPEVVAAIQRFMRHYQIENNKLIKDQYLKVHIRLAHILRDDLSEDAEELKFLLLEDWDHDSKGSGHMTEDDLFNSLFELVDIWTPDAEKEEYLGFFQILDEKFQRLPFEKFEKLYYQIME